MVPLCVVYIPFLTFSEALAASQVHSPIVLEIFYVTFSVFCFIVYVL